MLQILYAMRARYQSLALAFVSQSVERAFGPIESLTPRQREYIRLSQEAWFKDFFSLPSIICVNILTLVIFSHIIASMDPTLVAEKTVATGYQALVSLTVFAVICTLTTLAIRWLTKGLWSR